MDFLTQADLLSKVLGGVIGIAAAVFAFFRWVRPRASRFIQGLNLAWDSIVGRPPIYDSTVPGKILVPALPGIGARTAAIESSLAKLIDNDDRITKIEAWRTEVDRWRGEQDAHVVERVATRIESATAWAAVEAVAKAQPPEPELPGHGEN